MISARRSRCLAEGSGVQLQTEREDPQAQARRSRRERLYTLMERVTAYYARYLWEARESATAREYLVERGLSEQILREFRVGFSPSAWDRILVASRGAGFSDDELIAAGLAQRSRSAPGRIYDRFRARIMFPCADLRGRAVGFGARAMRENQPPNTSTRPRAKPATTSGRSFKPGGGRARCRGARGGSDPG